MGKEKRISKSELTEPESEHNVGYQSDTAQVKDYVEEDKISVMSDGEYIWRQQQKMEKTEIELEALAEEQYEKLITEGFTFQSFYSRRGKPKFVSFEVFIEEEKFLSTLSGDELERYTQRKLETCYIEAGQFCPAEFHLLFLRWRDLATDALERLAETEQTLKELQEDPLELAKTSQDLVNAQEIFSLWTKTYSRAHRLKRVTLYCGFDKCPLWEALGLPIVLQDADLFGYPFMLGSFSETDTATEDEEMNRWVLPIPRHHLHRWNDLHLGKAFLEARFEVTVMTELWRRLNTSYIDSFVSWVEFIIKEMQLDEIFNIRYFDLARLYKSYSCTNLVGNWRVSRFITTDNKQNGCVPILQADSCGISEGRFDLHAITSKNLAVENRVAQLYSSMVMLQAKYGIMTSRDMVWFFKRNNTGDLWVTKGYSVQARGSRSLRRALYQFLLLVSDDMDTTHQTPAPGSFLDYSLQNLWGAYSTDEAGSAMLYAGLAQARFEYEDGWETSYQNEKRQQLLKLLPLSTSHFYIPLPWDPTYSYLQAGAHGYLPVVSYELHQGVKVVVKTIMITGAYVEKTSAVRTLEKGHVEARMYSECLHHLQGEYIPFLIYAGRFHGRSILVTSYEGESLQDMQNNMSEGSTLPEDICDKALEALRAVHNSGVIHGSVYLRNFVYDKDSGRVMLIDFERSRVKLELYESYFFGHSTEEMIDDYFRSHAGPEEHKLMSALQMDGYAY